MKHPQENLPFPDELRCYLHRTGVVAYRQDGTIYLKLHEVPHPYHIDDYGGDYRSYLLTLAHQVEADLFRQAVPALQAKLREVDDGGFRALLYEQEAEWSRQCMASQDWLAWVRREIDLRLLKKRLG